MDHRAEEAHKFWEKRIGIDLHSVPWQLCKSMIAIYYRNNMLERLIKVHFWLMCLQELQRYISISLICPRWSSMKYLSKFDLDNWTFSSSQLHVTYIYVNYFLLFSHGPCKQEKKSDASPAGKWRGGGGGELEKGEKQSFLLFAIFYVDPTDRKSSWLSEFFKLTNWFRQMPKSDNWMFLKIQTVHMRSVRAVIIIIISIIWLEKWSELWNSF